MVLILKSCLETHLDIAFLANDTDFSDIKGALEHVQRLYLPSDYVEVMKRARNKISKRRAF